MFRLPDKEDVIQGCYSFFKPKGLPISHIGKNNFQVQHKSKHCRNIYHLKYVFDGFAISKDKKCTLIRKITNKKKH